VYLHWQLSYTEFRSVKRWVLADEIGFSPRQVTRALTLLVESGYLRQGDRQKGKVGSYALLPSRGEIAKQKSAA
jgi:DNA-binding IclR family transcriptional regulator